jgi:hypothetical protein
LNKEQHTHGRRRQRHGGRFVAVSLLTFAIASRFADSSIQAFHRSYGPKTSLLVSSPTLQWEVWPSDGAKVTSATMQINGREVDASYNAKHRRLEYHPDQPLRTGEYDVQCRVMVDGRLEVKKNWSFRVSPDAIPELPSPDASQDSGLAEANRYRRTLGLEPAYQESRLNAASLAHVKYLSRNRRTGHYEKPGEPGFVGATPSDRLEAFGYCGGSWECVSYNSGGVKESVRDLFHAPYHRIPFLQPGHMPVGTGMAGRNFSIKFGEGDKSGLSVSPGVNQSDIPTSWDGNESPNPLRMHGSDGRAVGYPIVFSYFGEENPTIKLRHASLTCDGEPIAFWANSSANDDHLENSIFIIPKRPLRPNTRYEVTVEASVNGKGSLEKNWSFTTGS